MSQRQRAVVIVASLTLVAAMTACGRDDAAESTASDGMIEQLVFPAEGQASQGGLANYNVYAPNPTLWNGLFEPLMIRNALTCEIIPWLATDYEWEGGDKLTFTIRDGVTWSDGTPFTAEDVAFTLSVGKEYPGADRAGLWNDSFGAPAESVTVEGNKVVITFTGNAVPKFEGIIGLQILPKHIYESVGDPTQYVDEKGIGTGPFTVASYNGRRLVLERRDDYWQADKIKVERIVHEGQYEAAQASLKLRSGELDAYTGEIPNPQRSFVDADPEHNHFFYAPAGMTVLTPNLTKAPFNDVKFREAIAYVMNKEEMSEKATYGIMKPASQSGLKLPYAAHFLPDRYTQEETILPYDPARAEQLLDAAGYRKGPDGKRTMPDGSPLSITFSVQAGWIDYQAIADVAVRSLNEIGIDTKLMPSAPESVDAQKKSGDFDLLLEYLHGGCDMARNLGSKLHSGQVPTETEVRSNVERWNDPATDATVDKLAASTDEAEQKELIGQLVDTMMTQFPVISLLYAPDRLIYRTDKAVGWPSEEDPYIHPGARLVILTHLRAPES